jgi:hypothetical protein
MKTWSRWIKTIILCVLSVAILLCILLLARSNTFERKIGRWIDSNCSTSSEVCILDIKDITSFEWDQMFVLNEGFEVEDIEKIVGVRPPSSDFSKRKILFEKEGAIVLYEELSSSLEDYVKYQVFFDIPTGKKYEVYTTETAVFIATKGERGYGPFYGLQRTENK